MQPSTIKKLIDINYLFYQTLAVQFSQARARVQPGVRRILAEVLADLPPAPAILDLGCGNGELAGELARAGLGGRYVGLDFSTEMLAQARRREAAWRAQAPASALQCTFLPASLEDPGWAERLQNEPDLPPSYHLALAFAVLHHLPGAELRRAVLAGVHRLLAPGRRFAHSHWQFLNSPRLRQRILPWETVGLAAEDVEPGDYLLDWKRGGYGLRYAHHFSVDELAALAAGTGFRVAQSFCSDGEGGKLGLYQVWIRD